MICTHAYYTYTVNDSCNHTSMFVQRLHTHTHTHTHRRVHRRRRRISSRGFAQDYRNTLSHNPFLMRNSTDLQDFKRGLPTRVYFPPRFYLVLNLTMPGYNGHYALLSSCEVPFALRILRYLRVVSYVFLWGGEGG